LVSAAIVHAAHHHGHPRGARHRGEQNPAPTVPVASSPIAITSIGTQHHPAVPHRARRATVCAGVAQLLIEPAVPGFSR
jgi:hypothetical protein